MDALFNGDYSGNLGEYIECVCKSMVDNRKISYLVVDPAFDPTMRYFAGMTEANEPYVSSAVPPEFRALFADHELMFMELWTKEQRSCRLHATEAELRLIRHRDRAAYIGLRIAYLEDLIANMRGMEPDHQADVAQALAYLKAEAAA